MMTHVGSKEICAADSGPRDSVTPASCGGTTAHNPVAVIASPATSAHPGDVTPSPANQSSNKPSCKSKARKERPQPIADILDADIPDAASILVTKPCEVAKPKRGLEMITDRAVAASRLPFDNKEFMRKHPGGIRAWGCRGWAWLLERILLRDFDAIKCVICLRIVAQYDLVAPAAPAIPLHDCPGVPSQDATSTGTAASSNPSAMDGAIVPYSCPEAPAPERKRRKNQIVPSCAEYLRDNPQHRLRRMDPRDAPGFVVPFWCDHCKRPVSAHELHRAKGLMQHTEKCQAHMKLVQGTFKQLALPAPESTELCTGYHSSEDTGLVPQLASNYAPSLRIWCTILHDGMRAACMCVRIRIVLHCAFDHMIKLKGVECVYSIASRIPPGQNWLVV